MSPAAPLSSPPPPSPSSPPPSPSPLPLSLPPTSMASTPTTAPTTFPETYSPSPAPTNRSSTLLVPSPTLPDTLPDTLPPSLSSTGPSNASPPFTYFPSTAAPSQLLSSSPTSSSTPSPTTADVAVVTKVATVLFSSAALDQLPDDFSAKFEERLVQHSQDAGTKVVVIVESLTAGSVLVNFSASFYTEGDEVAQADAAQVAASKLETDLETNCSAIFQGDTYFDQYGKAELASDISTMQSGYLPTTSTSVRTTALKSMIWTGNVLFRDSKPECYYI
ncbi:hypothetical protein CYMTET_17025 [Cymbomonas tetramitiformis]|uniref:Uncharacterized protein n=1 Tax=Cymbomonas tetramitiformis TaxID=36881 RepID=A0AAE0L7C8_9CHLO|nr:hypothetical protein CYMTET_17025 [Cymbomonas tetramitiformis]